MPNASVGHIEKLEKQLKDRLEILIAHMQGREISEEEMRFNHYSVPYRWVNSGDVRVAVDDFATILKEIKASLGKR